MEILMMFQKYFFYTKENSSKNGRLRTILSIGSAIVLTATTILANTALTSAVTQDDVDRANDTLNNLRSEQHSISSNLSDLNSQLDATGQRIASLEEQMRTKQSEIDTLQGEINDLSVQIAAQYDAMKLRIQFMYEKDNADFMELFLTSTSLSELLTRTEYVRQISEYDRNMLGVLNDTYTRQKDASAALTADYNDLNTLKTQADAEAANLNNLVAQMQTRLDNATADVTEAEQRALQYEQELEKQRIAQEQAEAEAARQAAAARAAANNTTMNDGVSYDIPAASNSSPTAHNASDVAMLGAIIECEAGNQPYIGKLAVGSVVINRMNSSRFPNTMSGVLYAPGQFSPVASGRFAIVLARGASDSCMQAAEEVLNGNIVIDALFFHVYRSGVDDYGTVIGDHIFY